VTTLPLRADGRTYDETRPVTVETGFFPFAEGSALIRFGDTHVACAASVDATVPPFLRGTGRGWVTAEYRMLPRATNTRVPREGTSGGLSGRTQEIQRLIGRSLRAVVDLPALGERSITVDCDVLRADGGTRTAAVTGGCVALALALDRLVRDGHLAASPLRGLVAALSAGVVDGRAILDLCYSEDSRAEVDCNVVMTDRLEIIEYQSTAERSPLTRQGLLALLDLTEAGIARLIDLQRTTLAGEGIVLAST
jgi:ribonuclease PH